MVEAPVPVAASRALEGALELSRRMVDEARAGHWDDIPALDGERMKFLRAACESVPASLDEAERRAGALEAIRKLNESLIRLGETGRENMRSQLLAMNQGRTATRAYIRTGGG